MGTFRVAEKQRIGFSSIFSAAWWVRKFVHREGHEPKIPYADANALGTRPVLAQNMDCNSEPGTRESRARRGKTDGTGLRGLHFGILGSGLPTVGSYCNGFHARIQWTMGRFRSRL